MHAANCYAKPGVRKREKAQFYQNAVTRATKLMVKSYDDGPKIPEEKVIFEHVTPQISQKSVRKPENDPPKKKFMAGKYNPNDPRRKIPKKKKKKKK